MPRVQRCLNPIPSIHPYGRSWKSAWMVDPSRKGLITQQLSIQASCGSSKLQVKSSFCIQCRSWSPFFCWLTIHSCCWFPVSRSLGCWSLGLLEAPLESSPHKSCTLNRIKLYWLILIFPPKTTTKHLEIQVSSGCKPPVCLMSAFIF